MRFAIKFDDNLSNLPAKFTGKGLLQDQVTVSVTRPEWPVSS
ncbi:Uncharacterised protein [Mycobacteroides abscessus]|nr:hypothetical protein [Mycobacteroides abscessus]CPS33102.1 Uncharacterised protein [Mycobacteroides abscessus]CPS71197.1 Uncharacterised protein [Mycobacteroides abscessus]CPT27559.1 Uncharacterised protein [Mycobacteroides abscessus]CPT28136.1 Uncharacterised protein [Mycobacteroides abscessus]CPT83635.1 Uncharacterised protein [Mycobacteroides abscessus]